jgi:cation transport ATPase
MKIDKKETKINEIELEKTTSKEIKTDKTEKEIKTDKTEKESKKEAANKRIKQIFAWIAIVIIALLYVASFLLSVLNIPGSQGVFEAALVSTLLFPLLIYVYMWLAGVLKGRGNK